MVELAREAFLSKNFRLSAEIYESAIKTDGPRAETLLGLADSQARAGEFQKALSTYIRCVRHGSVSPRNMRHFATGLADFMAENGAELGLIPPVTKDPSSYFLCGICSGLLFEPVTLPCGHCFCQICVQKNSSDKSCKVCKVVHYFVDINSLKTNVVLWTIIKKLFHFEIEGAKLRAEGNEQFARKHYETSIAIYSRAAEKGS